MKEETLTTPTKKSVLTKSQKQIITRMRPRKKYRAEVRYDDECGNGHNTFAILVEWWEQAKNNRWVWCGSGCGDSAENFDRVFPELVPLAKWHLMSSDGPMYYIANTVYHASDRDCWGHKAGEPSSFREVAYFGNSPIPVHLRSEKFAEFLRTLKKGSAVPVAVPHESTKAHEIYSDNATLKGFKATWGSCPFNHMHDAEAFCKAFNSVPMRLGRISTERSKGKARDLAAARASAIWPEATDEQLCLPKKQLTKLLNARLPALMAEFRKDIEAFGFVF